MLISPLLECAADGWKVDDAFHCLFAPVLCESEVDWRERGGSIGYIHRTKTAPYHSYVSSTSVFISHHLFLSQRESCPDGQHGGVLKKKNALTLFNTPNASATASARGKGEYIYRWTRRPIGGKAGLGTGDSGNDVNKVGFRSGGARLPEL